MALPWFRCAHQSPAINTVPLGLPYYWNRPKWSRKAWRKQFPGLETYRPHNFVLFVIKEWGYSRAGGRDLSWYGPAPCGWSTYFVLVQYNGHESDLWIGQNWFWILSLLLIAISKLLNPGGQPFPNLWNRSGYSYYTVLCRTKKTPSFIDPTHIQDVFIYTLLPHWGKKKQIKFLPSWTYILLKGDRK